MANKEIKIGNTIINADSEPYLIAEIGINHNGDLQVAKKLLDAVNATNWNCAKFQKRTPDLAVPEAQKGVMKDTPWGQMTYLEYKHKLEFGKDEFDVIDSYCRLKPLDWTASPWDIPSLEFLLQYDIPFIKIASATNANTELLKLAARSGKPLMVSTGMSTLEEVDALVGILEKESQGNYILMHTNAVYPTPNNELNLNAIKTLQQRYDCLVGYSGHEQAVQPSIVAISLGAVVLERHVTLSHLMWGSDHMASLEVHGMDFIKKRLLGVLEVLGDGQIGLTEGEMEARKRLRGEE
ncbi:MAG: N-acetylneuraminate synthase family protein [Lachnospiraceae bacterium]|jgi:N-acetylneuraminate synthase|nr:N-acetylneuraminate synthase family protein [Lachnospiraceae bacterium]